MQPVLQVYGMNEDVRDKGREEVSHRITSQSSGSVITHFIPFIYDVNMFAYSFV